MVEHSIVVCDAVAERIDHHYVVSRAGAVSDEALHVDSRERLRSGLRNQTLGLPEDIAVKGKSQPAYDNETEQTSRGCSKQPASGQRSGEYLPSARSHLSRKDDDAQRPRRKQRDEHQGV